MDLECDGAEAEPQFMVYRDPTPEELTHYKGSLANYRFQVSSHLL
jgi:hypothetical protein